MESLSVRYLRTSGFVSEKSHVRVTVLRLPLETAIFVMRIPILFQIS